MTTEEVKKYLRIDDDYEDDFIEELIATSEIYINTCVGLSYKTDEKAMKLATLVQKKIIADMYENRSSEVENKTKQDRIVTTILDKLSNYEAV